MVVFAAAPQEERRFALGNDGRQVLAAAPRGEEWRFAPGHEGRPAKAAAPQGEEWRSAPGNDGRQVVAAAPQEERRFAQRDDAHLVVAAAPWALERRFAPEGDGSQVVAAAPRQDERRSAPGYEGRPANAAAPQALDWRFAPSNELPHPAVGRFLTTTGAVAPFNITSPAKPEIKVIKDLNANSKSLIYFNLTTAQEIPPTEAHTKNWDIAFSKTTIATNSGTSGPGDGGAVMLFQPFDQISEAPKDGYKTDGDAGYAIPGGSGNSWYKYDMSVHAILPIPGRTLLVRTAEGKYAKVEIISYYKGAPEEVPTEESSYYTFRYVIAGTDGKF